MKRRVSLVVAPAPSTTGSPPPPSGTPHSRIGCSAVPRFDSRILDR
jgi:hypothetical protein